MVIRRFARSYNAQQYCALLTEGGVNHTLISVSWFSVDTDELTSVWFPCNGKVEKGDLVSMVNRMVGC